MSDPRRNLPPPVRPGDFRRLIRALRTRSYEDLLIWQLRKPTADAPQLEPKEPSDDPESHRP